MPNIQDLSPKGDIDEDYRFIVALDTTVTAATGHSLRFRFTGPHGRTDVSPSVLVNATTTPQVEVTSVSRKEITCLVSGFTLASGTYHGVLKKTDAGQRATFARWRMEVRPDQTEV